MKFKLRVVFALTWSLLLVRVLPADEKPVSVHDRLDAHKAEHEILLKDFIKEKKCQWNKSRDKLFEVQLLSGKLDIENELALPEGTGKAMAFFDGLVLRSETGIKSIEAVELLDDHGKRIKLDQLGSNETTLVFLLPQKLDRNSPLRLAVFAKEKTELSNVSIRSKSGVFKDFAKLKKWWLTFSKSSDLQLRFLEDTANMSLGELLTALGENSEASVRFIAPATLPTSGGNTISMWGILADRRISRIHDLLSALEPEVAETLARGNFDKQFNLFTDYFDENFYHSSVPVALLHAMDSSLFLCSEFCSPEEFQGLVDKWQLWHVETLGLTREGKPFTSASQLSPMLLGSLKASIFMREKGLTVEEAQAWLRDSLPDHLKPGSITTPRLRANWMMSWDSTPNRPIPLKAFPVFESEYQFIEDGAEEAVLEAFRLDDPKPDR